MADDGIKHFGLGALVGGALAYWARGLQERAERTGRAVGARAYGAGAEPQVDTVTPAAAFAGRSCLARSRSARAGPLRVRGRGGDIVVLLVCPHGGDVVLGDGAGTCGPRDPSARNRPNRASGSARVSRRGRRPAWQDEAP